MPASDFKELRRAHDMGREHAAVRHDGRFARFCVSLLFAFGITSTLNEWWTARSNKHSHTQPE